MRKFPQIDSPFVIDPADLPVREDGRVDWPEVFGRAHPLRIEVGIGNSPFLIEVARLEPEFNYLGFEYSRKRLLKFMKKLAASGVDSIRGLLLNAVPFLREHVRDGDVDQILLNFPDPWPKRRHAKNRFVQDDIIEMVAKKLGTRGGMSLRTDARAYAEQMIDVLDRSPLLVNLSGPGNFATGPRHHFCTPFEIKYIEEGRRIYYLEYEKAASDEEG